MERRRIATPLRSGVVGLLAVLGVLVASLGATTGVSVVDLAGREVVGRAAPRSEGIPASRARVASAEDRTRPQPAGIGGPWHTPPAAVVTVAALLLLALGATRSLTPADAEARRPRGRAPPRRLAPFVP